MVFVKNDEIIRTYKLIELKQFLEY